MAAITNNVLTSRRLFFFFNSLFHIIFHSYFHSWFVVRCPEYFVNLFAFLYFYMSPFFLFFFLKKGPSCSFEEANSN